MVSGPRAQVGTEPARYRRLERWPRPIAAPAAADPEREARLSAIRAHEGVPVEDPPWLFKLVVAWGWVVLAAALTVAMWLIARLL